mmetsp:Transcript_13065/g.29689  ORF Transcript_13065/g.29689 Transcript_13065/m.29689 type:complete len:249 (-) Transcript_13065:226-972(-)
MRPPNMAITWLPSSPVSKSLVLPHRGENGSSSSCFHSPVPTRKAERGNAHKSRKIAVCSFPCAVLLMPLPPPTIKCVALATVMWPRRGGGGFAVSISRHLPSTRDAVSISSSNTHKSFRIPFTLVVLQPPKSAKPCSLSIGVLPGFHLRPGCLSGTNDGYCHLSVAKSYAHVSSRTLALARSFSALATVSGNPSSSSKPSSSSSISSPSSLFFSRRLPFLVSSHSSPLPPKAIITSLSASVPVRGLTK